MEKRNLKQKILAVIVLSTCYFLLTTSVVSAGVIRKPPNNLGLVGYWPLNEGTGGVASDHSGGRNHGILTDMDTAIAWINGKRGKALTFDGSDDYILIGSASSLRPRAGDFSVSLWYRGISGTAESFLGTTSGGITWSVGELNSLGTGTAYFDANTFPFRNIRGNFSLPVDNDWHHLVVVLNRTPSPDTLSVYLDGQTASVTHTLQSLDGQDLNVTKSINIGMNTAGGDFTRNGPLDEVRIYNRALSAAEVLALYQSGTAKIGLTNLSPGTLKNGLTGHWTFDGKDMVSNVADLSGSECHGYLQNFAATTTVPGKVGQALKFDNSNDYIDLEAGCTYGDVFMSASEGTISAWVRPVGTGPSCSTTAMYNCDLAVSGGATLIGFGIGRGNNTTLGSNMIWASNSNGFASHQVVGVDYIPGEWAHITWVHSGGVLSIYKNGEFASSTPSGNTYTDVLNGNLWIGRGWAGSGNNLWNGDIDDVRTWNRALTASEIKQVYGVGAGQKVSTTKTPVGTLQSGLTGHWTFDGKDMVSNVADVSGNVRHGFLVGQTSTTTTIGKIGQGIKLDGVNDYMNTGVSYTTFISSSEGTISVWVKPTGIAPTISFSVDGIPIGKNAVSSLGIISPLGIMQVNNTDYGGDMLWVYNRDTDGHDAVGVQYNSNEWTHITWVHTGGTLYLYKNGTLATSSPSGNTSNIGGALSLVAGTTWSGWNAPTWEGDIDDLRVYNKGLTANEVKQLYNLGK